MLFRSATLCALNAQLVLQSVEGVRTVPITSFYTGPGKTVRKQNELLTQIRIAPQDYQGFGGDYYKYGKRAAMEIATLGFTTLVQLSADKQTIPDLRVAFAVAAPTPIRCPQTEAIAIGQPYSEALCKQLRDHVLTQVNPRSSWRASKEFRLQLIAEMLERTLKTAFLRAGGNVEV